MTSDHPPADYDFLVELLRQAVGHEDDARLTQGEVAAQIVTRYGDRTLDGAARDANVNVKTLYERRAVVQFYELSAPPTIGESCARGLLEELPVIRWTHLRLATRLGDRERAIAALLYAHDRGLTPQDFERLVGKWLRAHGYEPTKLVIKGRAGYTLTITRPARGRDDGRGTENLD